MNAPDPNGLTPAEAAWLRDPRHPVNNGFRMYPVPNLIVDNNVSFRSYWERTNHVSHWMQENIILVHHTPLQRFLFKSGMIALMIVFVVLPPILFLPMT